MVTKLWGKKIGMTQLFTDEKVVPVTAIDVGQWIITGLKTKERDGYNAVQVGRVKDRYAQQDFSPEWLKKLKTYFNFVKEVPVSDENHGLLVGQQALSHSILAVGSKVHVAGTTIGRGFAGVMKRHNFKGSPGSHGSNMGKRPGSSGFMRSQGRVIKGKRFPGHMGVDLRTMQNLEVIRIEDNAQVILVKGSIPGKTGSLVCISKV